MPKAASCQRDAVSPSMILSVFTQLKANGYSENQILALSQGLVEYAADKLSPKRETPHYLSLAENPREDI